jgi:hypothetical protein
MTRSTNPNGDETMTTPTYYAAIDASSPQCGAVFGVGTSPEAALADCDPESVGLTVVPCSARAFAEVSDNGGHPHHPLCVSGQIVQVDEEIEQ